MSRKPENFLDRARDYFHDVLVMRKLRSLFPAEPLSLPYKPQKRLLYVAASSLPYHLSGYAVRTHEIAKALKKKGVDAKFVTRPGYPWDRKDILRRPESGQTELDGLIYEHSRHPTQFSLLTRYVAAGAKVVAEMAQRHEVACIHAASNHFNALPALLAARRLGLPFQYEMRGLWELSKATRVRGYDGSRSFIWSLEMERFVAANADRVFVISDQLARFAISNWDIEPQKVHLLPNCVNESILNIPPSDEIDPWLVGYAGALVGYEGLDVLVEAIAILKKSGKNPRLLIIGDGDNRNDFEEKARQLNVLGAVSFMGRLEPAEARKMLGKCALVCIPRKPYPVCEIVTPLKLIEGMALGKAVVAPDLPVFRDEMGEHARGWLFRAGDPESLAETLQRVLDLPANLVEQGRKLKEHVKSRRQWQQHLDAVVELMEMQCLRA